MMLRIQDYETRLEPYLIATFASADWPEGFTPRLLLSVKLYRKAVQDLNQDADIADPRTKNPDIVKIMDKYAPDAAVSIYIRDNL
ncbi:hypothetical protein [Ascidiaceihabitans sp.]|uniref:hypothetical protein n=1 Tax=Ascidiaceihabitans sp. TaxID=1872644 RepID=UPI003298601A